MQERKDAGHSWKRRKGKEKKSDAAKAGGEELLTAPVTFPPPASLVLPWAICCCTDSTQHLHQHHQQEKRQLSGGHARLWSLHQGYSKESRAMGSAVPLSDIFHTAVWLENTSSPSFPWSVILGSRQRSPRMGHTFTRANPPPPPPFLGKILLKEIASQTNCNSSIDRKSK